MNYLTKSLLSIFVLSTVLFSFVGTVNAATFCSFLSTSCAVLSATPQITSFDVKHGEYVYPSFIAENDGTKTGKIVIKMIPNNSYFSYTDLEETVTLGKEESKQIFFNMKINDSTPTNHFSVDFKVTESAWNSMTFQNNTYTYTKTIDFTITDKAELEVYVQQENYYVNPDQTLEVWFDAINQGNKDGKVTIQLQPDEDDEDYFTAEKTSLTEEIGSNDTIEIKYKIRIEDKTPSDTYKVPFKVFRYYKDQYGNWAYQSDQTIEVTIHVNEYEPVDIELEDDVICTGTEAPFVTNLVFTNEGSKNYYIKPKPKSEDLWPKVSGSEIIEIQKDKDTKVEVKFNKIPMVGEYDLEIKQDLYENKLYENPKYFEKHLTVKVSNCKSEFVNLFINNDSVSVKQGEKGTISFDLINTTGSSMPVSISAESDDPTLNVVVGSEATVLETGQDYIGYVYVYPTDYTTSGLKTVTVTVTTPYSTETDSASIVVEKNSLNVTANPVEIPVGTKGSQTVTLQNNSGNKLSLNLYVTSGSTDSVSLSSNTLTLEAGETKTVTVGIVPKTLGSKKYTFGTTGSYTVSKEFFYSSNTSTTPSNFVVSYMANAETIVGKTVLLPVTLSNPYDSTITATMKLKGQEGVTSKTAYVVLNPKTQTSTTLEYTAYTAGTLKPTLEISTELGVENYPVTLKVKADASSANVLEIVDMPTEIPFVNGNEVTITFKVSNPNAFEVKSNTLRLTLEDGTVVGEKTFNIGSNAEKEITVKYTVESDEETTGTVSLVSGASENEYTVDFVKDSSFGNAGLFGLGFGGTLGIILGIVIVVLIILYFSLRGNEATSA